MNKRVVFFPLFFLSIIPPSSDIIALAVGFLGIKGKLCTHFRYGIWGYIDVVHTVSLISL